MCFEHFPRSSPAVFPALFEKCAKHCLQEHLHNDLFESAIIINTAPAGSYATKLRSLHIAQVRALAKPQIVGGWVMDTASPPGPQKGSGDHKDRRGPRRCYFGKV